MKAQISFPKILDLEASSLYTSSTAKASDCLWSLHRVWPYRTIGRSILVSCISQNLILNWHCRQIKDFCHENPVSRQTAYYLLDGLPIVSLSLKIGLHRCRRCLARFLKGLPLLVENQHTVSKNLLKSDYSLGRAQIWSGNELVELIKLAELVQQDGDRTFVEEHEVLWLVARVRVEVLA